MERGKTYPITIVDMGVDGEGIGRVGEMVVFVPMGIPGDRLAVRITQVKKRFARAEVVEVLSASDIRTGTVDGGCPFFGVCGGCAYLPIRYGAQLELKRKRVADALARIGGLEGIEVLPVLGAASPMHYRNKASFCVGYENGRTVLGYRQRKGTQVVPIRDCRLLPPEMEALRKRVEAEINDLDLLPSGMEGKGTKLRHVILRQMQTGEAGVCFVVDGPDFPEGMVLGKALGGKHGLTSIAYSGHDGRTGEILGAAPKTLWGGGKVMEKMGELEIGISPRAFYQVNSSQAQVLYEKVDAFAGITEKDVVVDAYGGIGSIALFLAPIAKKVYGIEINPDAVADAQENAKKNGIGNVEFLCMDAGEGLLKLEESGVRGDIMILDPPARGCGEKTAQRVLAHGAKRIIYVSCDPATLAKDLKLLAKGYDIQVVQPVDMFCHTPHVECVVLMTRKQMKNF
ncbi:23S rRNA (uracil(1939)-C(5))-methyltransferase RlmD [Eubacteriales bacterium OttesenSCG-928-M02]|nr:23S rRNA (uracil(1939)-C(5))-methyltransferase RlmD [Eubacteriales bacterium OttesenSCG-928-M02]